MHAVVGGSGAVWSQKLSSLLALETKFTEGAVAVPIGRRPLSAVRDLTLSAVRDLTRDGRWSSYDVSVLKKMGGKMRTDRTPSKATITNKTRPAGSFSSS
jgi:hypothetical protein